MKKIITLILFAMTLLFVSSCDTIAQVEYVDNAYDYYYQGRPVVIINGLYYYQIIHLGRIYYQPLPRHYWGHIRHIPRHGYNRPIPHNPHVGGRGMMPDRRVQPMRPQTNHYGGRSGGRTGRMK